MAPLESAYAVPQASVFLHKLDEKLCHLFLLEKETQRKQLALAKYIISSTVCWIFANKVCHELPVTDINIIIEILKNKYNILIVEAKTKMLCAELIYLKWRQASIC